MPTGTGPIPKPTRKGRKRLPRDRFAGLPLAKRMRIIDPAAIEAARKPFCEWCRRFYHRPQLEIHHVTARGMGGAGGASEGKGDDVPENLICLCKGPGTTNCHGSSDEHRPGYSIDDLRDIIAHRTT